MKLSHSIFFGLLVLHFVCTPTSKSNNAKKFLGGPLKIIKILNQIDKPIDGEFYIESISDARDFKYNIGVAHRKLERLIVVPLVLEEGFLNDLEKATNRWNPQKEGDQLVKVKILEIYLWDYFTARAEERFARVKLEFISAKNERLGVFTSLVFDKGPYERFSHEKRLEQAFWECIDKFNTQLKRSKKKETTPIVQNTEGKLPTYGAVHSFLDLKKRQYFKNIKPNLKKIYPIELARYKPRNQNELKSEYYAYLDNGEIYIKATNYTNAGDYFVKVETTGRYLLIIDKISTSSISKKLLDENKPEPTYMLLGIIIDGKSGVPKVVTDDYLKELVSPFPDLAQKYLIVDILNNPFQLERVRRLIDEINQRIEKYTVE